MQMVYLLYLLKGKMINYEQMTDHLIIRETVGYHCISKIELEDIPDVMEFLKIVFNYVKMKTLIDE